MLLFLLVGMPENGTEQDSLMKMEINAKWWQWHTVLQFSTKWTIEHYAASCIKENLRPRPLDI